MRAAGGIGLLLAAALALRSREKRIDRYAHQAVGADNTAQERVIRRLARGGAGRA